MDLKGYYQKVKEIEAKIEELFTVIVSLETGDGGKGGTQTEVSRSLAARMVVEGIARLATAAEKKLFYQQRAAQPPAGK
jgi:hypothetical protein